MWRRVLPGLALAGCNLVFPVDPTVSRGGAPGDSPRDSAPSDPSLVAHYPLDTLVSGETPDTSGRGHPAICAAATCPILIEDGRHGRAFEFTGTQHLRVVGQGTAFDLDTFTIALWVRATIGSQTARTMVALPLAAPGTIDNPWALVIEANVAVFNTAHQDHTPQIVEGLLTGGSRRDRRRHQRHPRAVLRG